MNNRIWHKGPPPHVGWWNASIYADDTAWRWWNGKHWSYVVYPWYPMVSVLKNAGTRPSGEHTEKRIQWTTYWPENALVPRVDPRKPPRFERIPDYPEAVLGHFVLINTGE